MRTNHNSNDFLHFMNRVFIAPEKRRQGTVLFPFFMLNNKMQGDQITSTESQKSLMSDHSFYHAYLRVDLSICAWSFHVRIVCYSYFKSCLFPYEILCTLQIIKITWMERSFFFFFWMERSWMCGGSEKLTLYRSYFWKFLWNSIIRE